LPSFFLAFLACALAILGGRESVSVARLSASLGQGPGLLAVIWISALATSAIAAWLGAAVAPLLFYEAKLVFAAIALLLGGLELLLLRPRAAPVEPTRSTGAILLVMFASQLTDGARFLVLALALATGSALLSGLGGALASGIVLSLAWAIGGEWEQRLPVTRLRFVAAFMLAASGVWPLLAGLGVIG
jgi:hypothetical protein